VLRPVQQQPPGADRAELLTPPLLLRSPPPASMSPGGLAVMPTCAVLSGCMTTTAMVRGCAAWWGPAAASLGAAAAAAAANAAAAAAAASSASSCRRRRCQGHTMLPSLRLLVHTTQKNPMTSNTITTAAVAQAAATAGAAAGVAQRGWWQGFRGVSTWPPALPSWDVSICQSPKAPAAPLASVVSLELPQQYHGALNPHARGQRAAQRACSMPLTCTVDIRPKESCLVPHPQPDFFKTSAAACKGSGRCGQTIGTRLGSK
jgi:hypothetical protein